VKMSVASLNVWRPMYDPHGIRTPQGRVSHASPFEDAKIVRARATESRLVEGRDTVLA
jgi:hypothetical protein